MVAIPAGISGVELGVLLAMVIYYDCVNWRAKKAYVEKASFINGGGDAEQETSFISSVESTIDYSSDDRPWEDKRTNKNTTSKNMY